MLNSEKECREFLATQNPATIALQIRTDQKQCRELNLPSLLALYLPPPRTNLADAIAIALYPETSSYPKVIRMAQYSGMILAIKTYLHDMNPGLKHEPLPDAIEETNKRPSKKEFETALDVLEFCMKNSGEQRSQLNLRTPLKEIIAILQEHVKDTFKTSGENPRILEVSGSKQRTCYICHFTLLNSHTLYPSLCNPCGEYNLASSALSLPENLNLSGKTALVTGARINLGYHTALRLLRSGAKVIVSTRYPRDAEVRYLREKDAGIWKTRLRIIGADFRAASDVFHLVAVVKRYLKEWGETGEVKLDILVNNAAQTLTDSLEKEDQAVRTEKRLEIERSKSKIPSLLEDTDYTPRIRGGVKVSNALGSSSSPLFLESAKKDNEASDYTICQNNEEHLRTNENPTKSSWMQTISQIPYEDVISAHSVNTFVPLILLREFLPIMGSPPFLGLANTPCVPAAYIINVSSREGIFESTPTSSSKHGHHVHTNLTKAALNMLTETEASPAWKGRRVAINSVDPGYMSAAPEIERAWKEKYGEELGKCPIGWEDGAGRVLWPIAISESGKGAIWGRFLKHFGSVEVDVSGGR